MRLEHVLLMGSIVVAGPVLSAEPKPTSENAAKTVREAQQKTHPAAGQAASDELPNQPNRKSRVHRTFPPPPRNL